MASRTYRITNIPETFNEQKLGERLVTIFKLNDVSEVKIHSLAADIPIGEGAHSAATISFRKCPQSLSPERSDDWADLDEIDDGVKVFIDDKFDGFTPLSPTENNKKQTIE